MALAGTSMATPHVAGAAAILAQEHPGWTAAQFKAALVASAKPNPALGVYAQGAGRVDVARAITQQRHHVAGDRQLRSPDLAAQRRHTDQPDGDLPQRRHRRGHVGPGAAHQGPDGKPAAAGMFTLTASKVTVPAGGEAQVTVTADTRVAGPDGFAGGVITATAGDAVVRTPIAVEKEVESYDLTINHRDRAGALTGQADTLVIGLDSFGFQDARHPSGIVKIRLPKGRYLLSSVLVGTPEKPELTQLVYPELTLDRAQTIEADGRLAKPIAITVPRPDAEGALAVVGVTLNTPEGGFGVGVINNSFDIIRTGQIGPATKLPNLVSNITGNWGKKDAGGTFANSPYTYALSYNQKGSFFNGFTRSVKDRELANVKADIAVEATGARGARSAFGILPDGSGGASWASMFSYDLPRTTNEYLNTDGGQQWVTATAQTVPSTDPQFPFPEVISEATSAPTTYRAGRTYHENWNRGVFGPALPPAGRSYGWAARLGDELLFSPPLYSDGAGRAGFSRTSKASITVSRDGTKLVEQPATGGVFNVPAATGQYKVTVDATRDMPFNLSSRVTGTWTFRSGHVDGTDPKTVPLLAVRFSPKLDRSNTAPADCAFTVPVTVDREGGAGRVRDLSVQVSYDDGKTWRKVRVSDGKVQLRHPKGHGFVSLRAAAADGSGNAVEETIIRAYRF